MAIKEDFLTTVYNVYHDWLWEMEKGSCCRKLPRFETKVQPGSDIVVSVNKTVISGHVGSLYSYKIYETVFVIKQSSDEVIEHCISEHCKGYFILQINDRNHRQWWKWNFL